MDTAFGTVYLIPTPLSGNDMSAVLPAAVFERIKHIQFFVVEEIKSARRFLSQAGLKGHLEQLHFFELNEHSNASVADEYIHIALDGNDIGIISEAGLPAVADPGALLVASAHRNGVKVVPLAGPSSLMMALMASGLNGQCFAFTGYLPVKPEQRREKIKLIERVSNSLKQTQIIIETPYRNNQLFSDIISTCSSSTRVTVACNITAPTEMILTKTAGEWKRFCLREKFEIPKEPTVFLLLA